MMMTGIALEGGPGTPLTSVLPHPRESSLHAPNRGVEDLVHEALVERGVAHEQPEEERAVEEGEGNFEVHVAPHLVVCLVSFEQGPAFRATREDEVVAERPR